MIIPFSLGYTINIDKYLLICLVLTYNIAHQRIAMGIKNNKTYNCPVELALDIIGGKWKALILWNLMDATRRFSELKRSIPKCTEKMLVQQLRDLEGAGLIDRRVYPEVPPKVEYSMSAYGKQLIPVLGALCEFGKDYSVRFDIRLGCLSDN
jgi:DNA-binding HxlR family transcriptional regulator